MGLSLSETLVAAISQRYGRENVGPKNVPMEAESLRAALQAFEDKVGIEVIDKTPIGIHHPERILSFAAADGSYSLESNGQLTKVQFKTRESEGMFSGFVDIVKGVSPYERVVTELTVAQFAQAYVGVALEQIESARKPHSTIDELRTTFGSIWK